MAADTLIEQRFSLLSGALDERLRRLVAASEAKVAGYGGVSLVARATGVSRRAIAVGMKELEAPTQLATSGDQPGRVRKIGGGRKKVTVRDSTLLKDLESLIEPLTRGDPESSLRWTCKSLRKLASELVNQGHEVSHRVVGELLEELGYSLQANRKTQEGSTNPDRNAQFEFINRRTREELALGNPVISVDPSTTIIIPHPVASFENVTKIEPLQECHFLVSFRSCVTWSSARRRA